MTRKHGIAMLSISAPVMGRSNTVHPVLLWDESDAVLIDTGFPGQIEQLRDAIAACGVDPDRVNRVVITHQDIDHIGNLQRWTENAQAPIEVCADVREKPYIEGAERLLRFTDEAIASVDRMPDSVPESFKAGLKAIMLRPPRAPVDRVIAGGMRLPWCGGLEVVDTAGHTPGHLSVYHSLSGTLIAGDALTANNGLLSGFDPNTTLDPAAAQASIVRLTALDVRQIMCYHGGLVADRAKEQLAQVAQSVRSAGSLS